MSDLVDAIETFKFTPEALTREHVALITKADPALGAQVRQRRQELRTKALADAVVTTIKSALAPRDEKIRQLEAEVAALRRIVEAAREREPEPA
jgi:hypothetical protein